MIGSDLADAWRAVGNSRGTLARVAVVIHLPLAAQPAQPLVDMLGTIPVLFDLFVTNSSGSRVQIDTSALQNVGTVSVFDAADQGRDLSPLVTLVNADLLEPYELVLKLNSEANLADLAQLTEQVASILAAFADDPSLGILGPMMSIRGSESWGENRELSAALMQRLQLGLEGRELRFVEGNIYWIRGFLLQGLRAFEISEWDFESEFGQLDGTMAHALERVLGLVADEAGFDVSEVSAIVAASVGESWRRYMPDAKRLLRARVLALYSPEFHSSGSEARWEPAGQLLWARLAATRPLFRGHTQPLLSTGLGFYDSRESGVLAAQFALAAASGLEGFAFNYFWHNGATRDIEPLTAHISGHHRNPFCIVWQNGSHRGTADGTAEQISHQNALRFFDDILPALKDSRYFTIGGMPVIVVARMDLIESYDEVLADWRRNAEAEGLSGLSILVLEESRRSESASEAMMQKGPDGVIVVPARSEFLAPVSRSAVSLGKRYHGAARRYDALANHTQRQLFAEHPTVSFPLVPVAYDNTPEKKGFADILIGANPFTFHRWLDGAALSVADRELSKRIIIIHGWNDWQVSAVLEPSDRFGSSYLLAVRDVLWR